MKLKFLLAAASLIVTTAVFAQMGELNNADNNFTKYMITRGQNFFAAMVTQQINEAKASIDKAAENPLTAALPKTYALKGAIYAALAMRDTVEKTDELLFNIANAALTRAKETDTREENKKLINDGYNDLAYVKYTWGVKNYQQHKYDIAYNDFNTLLIIRPDDTTALQITALAAANAKKYTEAIKDDNKLLKTNYSKNALVYIDLSWLYLVQHDTTNAFATLENGMRKYPDHQEIIVKMVRLNAKKTTDDVAAFMANNPGNINIWLTLGDAFLNIHKFEAAEAIYHKAIEFDPRRDYRGYGWLGQALMKDGLENYNRIKGLPLNKQSEHAEEMKKAMAKFEEARPLLQKAIEINPRDATAMGDLRMYYMVTNNKAKADSLQKVLTQY